jgi:hypothetical protein
MHYKSYSQITHNFRSLLFFSFASSSLLKCGRNVRARSLASGFLGLVLLESLLEGSLLLLLSEFSSISFSCDFLLVLLFSLLGLFLLLFLLSSSLLTSISGLLSLLFNSGLSDSGSGGLDSHLGKSALKFCIFELLLLLFAELLYGG